MNHPGVMSRIRLCGCNRQHLSSWPKATATMLGSGQCTALAKRHISYLRTSAVAPCLVVPHCIGRCDYQVRCLQKRDEAPRRTALNEGVWLQREASQSPAGAQPLATTIIPALSKRCRSFHSGSADSISLSPRVTSPASSNKQRHHAWLRIIAWAYEPIKCGD